MTLGLQPLPKADTLLGLETQQEDRGSARRCEDAAGKPSNAPQRAAKSAAEARLEPSRRRTQLLPGLAFGKSDGQN